MDASPSRPTRGHRPGPLVAVVVLVALAFLAWPTGAAGAPAAPLPVGVWPLRPTPTVLRGFEPPDSTWGTGHRGVDLAGAVGQDVHSALAGRVVFAARLAGRGVVVVDHGSTRTTYEPVVASVRVGDVLARGQPIGTLSMVASHCFPRVCLHWGWKRGATYLDPLLLVGGGPIVLLPLWEALPTTGPVQFRGFVPPYATEVERLIGRSVPSHARAAPARPAAVWRRPRAMGPPLM